MTQTITETTPLERIAELATHYRVQSIEMADRAGSGHPTSSMSAADLIAVLVTRHLRLDPGDPDAPGNDRLLFSKGHASPLLYAALDSMHLLDGRIDGDHDVVDCYRQPDSILEGHPTPKIPGVPTATGSLGLGLSVGVGLARANEMDGLDAHVWVLCGDGELMEGSNWEAIEHAATTPITGMTAIVDVNRLGQSGETRHGWQLGAFRSRFAGFGWETIVVDGHDLEEIDAAFGQARYADRPTAILAKTVKGRGASETANERGKHGKPLDDPERAIEELGGDRDVDAAPLRPAEVRARKPVTGHPTQLPSWEVGDDVATRDAFGEALVSLGRSTPRLVVLDGDVKNSTRTKAFAAEFPERFVEAYIAEQLMAGMAVGLDVGGWLPVMSTFGSFLSRAHDVLRMATIGRADLIVAGTHAGVSIGQDGPSQMALEDIAMMRSLANSIVVSPSDANQAAALLEQLLEEHGIRYLRLLRGATPVVHPADAPVRIGGSARIGDPERADVVLVGTGVTVHEALRARERLADDHIDAAVLDAYSIKPIDDEALASAATCGRIVVVEDHRPEGGLGEAVMASLARTGSSFARLTHLAVTEIAGSAPPAEQRVRAGIDANAIERAARASLA